MLRLRCAVALARAAAMASRIGGRGGTALPGLVALRVDPSLIERLAATIPGGVVVVTGTNGKTTTSKMISTMLSASGRRVLANRTGSNLARGLAATLALAARRGRVRADVAVFEIDEAAVRDLGPRLHPRVIVVTNLARDQLDRYGELETTARHVAVAVASAAVAVLDGDDPLVARLGGERTGDTRWFGAVPAIRVLLPDDRSLYGQAEPIHPGTRHATITGHAADGDGWRVEVALGDDTICFGLRVPGVYNAYNAAAALLAVQALGIDGAQAADALGGMEAAFGRGQTIVHRGRRVRVVLVKNPASLNQAMRLVGDEPGPVGVLVAINDLHADGRDVSWLWDAAVESLAGTRHRFGAAGLRAADMALRFKYAGIDAWVEPEPRAALRRLTDDAPEGGLVYLIPTYTALLAYLEVLLPGRSPGKVWR